MSFMQIHQQQSFMSRHIKGIEKAVTGIYQGKGKGRPEKKREAKTQSRAKRINTQEEMRETERKTSPTRGEINTKKLTGNTILYYTILCCRAEGHVLT